MEQSDRTPATNLEDIIPSQIPVTISGQDIHGEETQDQDLEDVEATNAYPLANSQPQSMLENGRGKETGSAIKSQIDDIGQQDSLRPQELKAQQNKENKPQDNPKVIRSQSFPLKETQSKDLHASRSNPLNEHYARIESENKQLREQLAGYKTAYSDSQRKLDELKADRAKLHGRLEETNATLFRIRPQRPEHTESEMQGYFYKLSESIKNWIETNCDEFLEDDDHGFEIMSNRPINGNSGVDSILMKFQGKTQDVIDVKEHVLAAILMRYLFDEILNRPLSILLMEGEEGFLNSIYENMATMDPPKDLPTRRTWKSDTATAIDSHPSLNSRYKKIKGKQLTNLYQCLQNILSRDHNSADIISSIEKEIVEPAIALAQKIQSAPSIWEFRYSEWCACEPGKPMAIMPNFLAIIEDYRCTNLSAYGKQLKIAADLATPDQQRRLVYILDIFPGLYCQRMTPAGFQQRTTVSKPVLIVSFVSDVSQRLTDPSDPITGMDGKTNVPLPDTVKAHRSANVDCIVMKGGQAQARSAPHSLDAEDADYRTENSSRGVDGSLTHPQSSCYHQEAMDSRGGARGRLQQPRRPALNNKGFIGAIKQFF